jgi:hypothetical protein
MTVLVQPGSGRITTGTYPSSYGYLISHDTTVGESVTVPTSAASPRIDYIVAYIDKAVAGSTLGTNVNNSNNVLKFADVAGTPAGSPVVPTVGQIQTAIGSAANPYVILAQLAVAASVSTITNPNITDLRKFVRATNGLALGASSYVDNGCVWTISSGLAGTMTAGLVYVNVGGVMVPVNLATIASNTFTASQDTYVYVNNTSTFSYSAVANNGASPASPANSILLAIVTTSPSAITNVNQGQEFMVIPIISSVALSVTDQLGNLICPRDPNRKTLGLRQIIGNVTTTSPTAVQITGLSVPCIIPYGRKVKVTLKLPTAFTTGGNDTAISIWNGTVGSGTQVTQASNETVASKAMSHEASLPTTQVAGFNTFNAGFMINGGSTFNTNAAATLPAYLLVELD